MSLFNKIVSLIALMGLLVPQVVFAEPITDFKITVSTDKELYDPDESVEITLEGENYSTEDLVLDFTTGCQMGIEIYKDQELLFDEDTYPRNCDPTPATLEIPAGKKAVWTRTLTAQDEGYPFQEFARYKIHAYIMDYKDETSVTSVVFGDELLYSFNDISEHWAKSYIQKLSDQSIVEGYEDGGFHPNDYINRAEMVKLALTAAGYNFEIAVIDENFKFNDLDDWQEPFVYRAWEDGIVEGYDEFTFAPAQNVTRAEAVKIALLAFKLEPGQLEGDYSFDDTIDHWAASYINEAYAKFIVSGREDGNFYPDDSITRAEASKIISLLIEL